MAAEGCPFTGVLFAGIMLVKGEPVLLEHNTRFGDPECQPLMMRLQCDLLEVLLAGAEGRLAEVADTIRWRDETALCVVMAANGYPGNYEKGSVIKIAPLDDGDNTQIFHAGTAFNDQDELVANGGRVLGVTALGETVSAAKDAAYRAVDQVDWPGGFCRRDIGWRALEAEKEG